MGWIPGWDSIAGAGWWSGFYFWLSIVSLIGLGVFEVASHRYGDRHDELAEHQRATENKQHDDEIARLHLEAANAQKSAEELRRQNLELEKAVTQGQLELQKLQNPRTILPDKLSEGLAGKPRAKVEIWYVSECSDCHWLANWLSAGLLQAEWTLEQGKPLPIPAGPNSAGSTGAPAMTKGGQPWGVSVLPADSSNPAAVALSGVLLKELGKLGGGKASDLPDGVVRLIVAPRP